MRLAATVLGLLGALLAIAVPLLPVVQDTAVINWPAGDGVAPVNAPLAAYQPQELSATVPCATAASLDARSPEPAPLVATTPPASSDGAEVGMLLQVADGNVAAISRGQLLGTAALPPGPCDVQVDSSVAGTTVTVGDRQVVDLDADVRPQVVGIYSALDATADPVDGLGVQITPDTRFQSVPHPVKFTAMGLAALAVLASLMLLHRLDQRVGRRAPRLAPPGWWMPTGRDITVIAVLAVWVVIGGITSDDGYILTMIQARDETGYMGNYYRWFNVAEAPFGWPYELYSVWAQLSTTPPWLRIPSFVMGVVSWLLISREIMPRLGREVRRSHAAGWAAAAAFLAFWLPYNNGLRLEPVVAIGSLLTLCAVERAVALRRVAPLAVGLLVAAFTVASTPTGFIAIAPFLVAARPVARLLRQHASASGWSAVLAPMLGAGLLILIVIFSDQTLRAVLEATQLRTAIGPSMSWFEEPNRYQALFSPTADGSLARRFPVLLLLLCLGTCLVVLLRRGSIPGAGLGPSRRLIGTAALSLALIALTPTKWTHHFGAFASLGAALAALTALATSTVVLRSARNRWWFLTGLLLILALAFTGPNAPWYVSQFGVPWFDRPPLLFGFKASTVLITAAAIAALIAVVENLRHEPGGPPPPRPGPPADWRQRALRVGSAPLAVICGLLVLAEVATMGKAIYAQRDSYSLGAANIEHVTGSSCNLSGSVMAERDRAEGAMPAVPVIGFDNLPFHDGFGRNRLPPTSPAEAEDESGTDDSLEGDRIDEEETEDNPVTAPPPGLGGDRLPVWSSYSPDGPGTGEVRTPWRELDPAAAEGRAPMVVAVAGRLGAATPITAQFGKRSERDGRRIELVEEIDVGGSPTADPPGWRDYRLNLAGSAAAAEADTVRLVAGDADVTPEGWLAFAEPRVPDLVPMTRFVGRDTPVFMDWPVGFVHPCMRPFAIRNGVVEMPEYRLLPDEQLMTGSENWSGADSGGPLGWLEIVSDEREIPTYLEGGWDVDWGELTAVEPLVGDTESPSVAAGTEVRAGWWSPGPMQGSGATSTDISPLTR
ncbi:MAG: arabinosyltransferase [Pseudonocardiaceae bacterium]|nr:arabinosyltransferase [Pseudonocardiaceae bacterium]